MKKESSARVEVVPPWCNQGLGEHFPQTERGMLKSVPPGQIGTIEAAERLPTASCVVAHLCHTRRKVYFGLGLVTQDFLFVFSELLVILRATLKTQAF